MKLLAREKAGVMETSFFPNVHPSLRPALLARLIDLYRLEPAGTRGSLRTFVEEGKAAARSSQPHSKS